jgi:hypothetical protein
MPEATVFDAYRAAKAIDGHLREGDSLQHVAVDDVTGDYWITTAHELILVADSAIKVRYPFERLRGEVTTSAAGVDVRVRDAGGQGLSIASFRRPNKVTERLATLLAATPGDS